MKIAAYSTTQICVKRDNGAIIYRTIIEDTPQRRESANRWIANYNKRKAAK